MKKELLLFATLLEAQPTIAILRAQPLLEGQCYLFEQGYIVISGMGLMATQRTLLAWREKVDSICNLGLCASLQSYRVGEILEVATLGSQAAPLIQLGVCGVRLFSSHYPLHSKTLKEKLRDKWDIVDMEGYAVASISAYLQIPCTFLKIISDFAQEGGIAEIQKNFTLCANALANKVFSRYN